MNLVRRIRELLRLIGLRPMRFVAAVILGAAAVILGVLLLGVSGYLIAKASTQPAIMSLTVLIVLVRALAIGKPVSRYLERLVAHDFAFRSLALLRVAIFDRIEPLAPAELEQYRDGELLSRMVRDVDDVQDLILRVLMPVSIAFVAVPTVIVGVAIVLPSAAVVLALGLGAGVAFAPVAANRLAARARGRQAELRGELTAELVDALDAAPELWLYGADAEVEARVMETDEELLDGSLQDARGAGAAESLAIAVSGLTSLGVLWVAAAAAGTGGLDPLFVVPLTLVAAAAFEAVTPLAVASRMMPSVRAALARVLDLAERRPGVVDPDDPAAGPSPRPRIVVRDLVVERGRPAHRVLDGVDIDAAPGTRVVIEGVSGVGKTTLLEVLVRFLERSGGAVTVDGVDIRTYAQDGVREQVVLLTQDPHLFASNIRENVALARPGSDDEAIFAALDRAQIGSWVRSLPEGLDTLVGERGSAVSGGQRQRIAMARAFLAEPSVLLLDEPTAHLDTETAQALLQDLWHTAGDRTVILVAHTDPGPFAVCHRVALGVPPDTT